MEAVIYVEKAVFYQVLTTYVISVPYRPRKFFCGTASSGYPDWLWIHEFTNSYSVLFNFSLDLFIRNFFFFQGILCSVSVSEVILSWSALVPNCFREFCLDPGHEVYSCCFCVVFSTRSTPFGELMFCPSWQCIDYDSSCCWSLGLF